jgi:hypothetical protein
MTENNLKTQYRTSETGFPLIIDELTSSDTTVTSSSKCRNATSHGIWNGMMRKLNLKLWNLKSWNLHENFISATRAHTHTFPQVFLLAEKLFLSGKFQYLLCLLLKNLDFWWFLWKFCVYDVFSQHN